MANINTTQNPPITQTEYDRFGMEINGPKFTPEEIARNLARAEAAAEYARILRQESEDEAETARREALDNCPIKSGMTVVRKNKPNVRGKVVRVLLYNNPDTIKDRYVWRPRCWVAWEGAISGRWRFRGGEWNITTTVLADSLEVAR